VSHQSENAWWDGVPEPYGQVALEGHTDNVTSCVWNPDGTRLATASSAVTKTVGGMVARALRVCFSSPSTFAHR
jgi:WD40 repeat protein